MHAKTDSDVTSLAPSSPPRSPRRPIYYVMSPSHPDAEKMSLGGSTPGGGGSPVPHHQHHHNNHRYTIDSPIHHSRESSTTRFSASLKQHSSWRKLHDFRLRVPPNQVDDDEDDGEYDDTGRSVRCYVVLFLLGFILLFSLFSLILWGASKSYKPEVHVKGVVFEGYNVQAGMDLTGVPTKMLSLNSTVRIRFRNPATFFGVHVSSTPLQLYYYQLNVASGQMKEFYESRKSERVVSIVVAGTEVPLYGGGSSLTSRANGGGSGAVVPLELTFVVRARARVLGKLVRSKFYRHVRCSLVLRENRLGKPVRNITSSCRYRE
ncbi:uncharacterized protein M6B38_356665 [Iris pallida]|uniref:Late embryogenesis abundant protein LEA-2 subgroup domain-containing protein n=1 Tax=Iris pallida TaxID=29817 RepID=A0AAX6GEW8_IRIPA|nr:uncharacterized protein M6B38_369095 [Iris pallida]KAJ6829689.1 uncharacterized protein M6B38_356665 [Iris pallida]